MFEMIQQTNFRILDWIQANLRTPWLDWFAPKVTFLCEAGWFWIALTLVFLLWKKHRRLGATMFVGLVLCVLFGNIILKHAVARPRPCWINQNIDMLVGIPAVILAALIALSRLYLYVHFPTDVLVGTLMGIFFAFLAKRILDHFFPVVAKDAVKRTEKAGREDS